MCGLRQGKRVLVAAFRHQNDLAPFAEGVGGAHTRPENKQHGAATCRQDAGRIAGLPPER
jgi:hypothetical protein